MRIRPSTNIYRHSWNSINILVATVIIVNYFNIFQHYWFVKLFGGYIIKIWLLPALLLFLIAIQMAASGRNITLKKDGIYSVKVLVFFYFVFGFTSLFAHGEGKWYLGKYSLFMFMPVILFTIIIARFKDNEDIKKVLQILFVSGLVMSLYVEYLYFTGTLYFEPIITNVGEIGFEGDSSVFTSKAVAAIRHGMPGVGINTYAAMLVPLVFVGLYLAQNYRGLLKYFYYASAVFILFAVMVTLSRAAFISLTVGLLLYQWYNRRKYLMFILSISLLISAVLLNKGILLRILEMLASVNIFTSSQYINNSILSYGVRVQTEGHLATIPESISAFSESPFFGVGMNNMQVINEHNRYLEILATNGLAGFVPYIALILLMIFISRKRLLKELRNNSPNQEIGVTLFAGLITFAVYLNAAPTEYYFYWIWFGLAMAWVRNCGISQHRKKHML